MKDKVVIITGASSGIGEACAFAFAAKGAKIVLVARNHKKLLHIQELLKKYHGETLVLQADVSVQENCKLLIKKTLEKFNHIDVLVNNAGISMRALIEDVDFEALKKVMDTNFWGTVYCTKYALPYLLKVKGSVVGVSSIAGYKGLPARSGYCSSKFAMNGFLESLRIENLKKGLHVLIVAPGFTNTNIRNTALNKNGDEQSESPLDEKKLMSSKEVAEHIFNAVIKRKREVILTMQGKLTVLLNRYFPSLMDKVVYNFFVNEKNSPLK